MTISEAIHQIFEAEDNLETGFISRQTKAIGVARMGFDDQNIVAGTLEELLKVDMGAPLHSLIICAPKLHEIEEEMFEFYSIKK